MRLHRLALRASDCERARAFYGDLLGLPELRRDEPQGTLRAVWLRAGHAVLMLERKLRGSGPEAGSGHVLALAQDPDGHRVGVSSFPLT